MSRTKAGRRFYFNQFKTLVITFNVDITGCKRAHEQHATVHNIVVATETIEKKKERHDETISRTLTQTPPFHRYHHTSCPINKLFNTYTAHR